MPDDRTIYVGLDLSWTGLGMFKSRGPIAVADEEQVLIHAPKAGFISRVERLHSIMTNLESRYPGGKNVKVAIEGYAHASRGEREMTGELHGAVKLSLYRHGFNFVVIQPTTLKSYVTGSGIADKNVMLKEILKKWGFDTDNDNIGDAYALMQFCREYYQPLHSEDFGALIKRAKKLEIVHGAG